MLCEGDGYVRVSVVRLYREKGTTSTRSSGRQVDLVVRRKRCDKELWLTGQHRRESRADLSVFSSHGRLADSGIL
jgi:hypothetical protein